MIDVWHDRGVGFALEASVEDPRDSHRREKLIGRIGRLIRPLRQFDGSKSVSRRDLAIAIAILVAVQAVDHEVWSQIGDVLVMIGGIGLILACPVVCVWALAKFALWSDARSDRIYHLSPAIAADQLTACGLDQKKAPFRTTRDAKVNCRLCLDVSAKQRTRAEAQEMHRQIDEVTAYYNGRMLSRDESRALSLQMNWILAGLGRPFCPMCARRPFEIELTAAGAVLTCQCGYQATRRPQSASTGAITSDNLTVTDLPRNQSSTTCATSIGTPETYEYKSLRVVAVENFGPIKELFTRVEFRGGLVLTMGLAVLYAFGWSLWHGESMVGWTWNVAAAVVGALGVVLTPLFFVVIPASAGCTVFAYALDRLYNRHGRQYERATSNCWEWWVSVIPGALIGIVMLALSAGIYEWSLDFPEIGPRIESMIAAWR